jgi:toxin ParE1/3/4
LRFTGENWGPNQLHRYRDKLDEALRAIGANPGLGHCTPDLPETHRLHPVGSHVIVYRTDESGVGVVRILHQRMNLMRHLPTTS